MNVDRLYGMLDNGAQFVHDHTYVKQMEMLFTPKTGMAQTTVEMIDGEKVVLTRYFKAEAR